MYFKRLASNYSDHDNINRLFIHGFVDNLMYTVVHVVDYKITIYQNTCTCISSFNWIVSHNVHKENLMNVSG